MSYLFVATEALSSAASDAAGIGSALRSANSAVAAPTTAIVAAGVDEVSMAVATLFSGHGQAYQNLSTAATAFHDRFVRVLTANASLYGDAEAANLALLQQQILDAVNAPVQAAMGRPLIGDGADGAPGSGADGGAGES